MVKLTKKKIGIIISAIISIIIGGTSYSFTFQSIQDSNIIQDVQDSNINQGSGNQFNFENSTVEQIIINSTINEGISNETQFRLDTFEKYFEKLFKEIELSKQGRLSVDEEILVELKFEHFQKGYDAIQNEIYGEAITEFDKVIRLDPNDLGAKNNKAVALSLAGQHLEAIPLYLEILNKTQNFPDALVNIAHSYSNLGNYADAIRYYGMALTFDYNKNDAHLWNNLGYVYGKLNKLEDAISAYDISLSIDKNHFDSLNNKGSILAYWGYQNEAIKLFDKIIELDKNYVKAHNNKGWALERLGYYEEAIKEYEIARSLEPDYVDTINNILSANEKLDRLDNAIPIIQHRVTPLTLNEGEFHVLGKCQENEVVITGGLEQNYSSLNLRYSDLVNENSWQLDGKNTGEQSVFEFFLRCVEIAQ